MYARFYIYVFCSLFRDIKKRIHCSQTGILDFLYLSDWACPKINDIGFSVFYVAWKGVFFFSWIHEMKLYQILYCFLSFYLKGVYDIHAGKHKHAHTITQEASSLGFQERTFICLLLCDDISLSRILQFFPVFKFLFRDLGHQILQGKNGKICNCWKCTKCSFSWSIIVE